MKYFPTILMVNQFAVQIGTICTNIQVQWYLTLHYVIKNVTIFINNFMQNLKKNNEKIMEFSITSFKIMK